ncbi:MAG: putative secreted protein [Frankiales bacterium]|nr:putative secreted protein [Frankiales bacterium]
MRSKAPAVALLSAAVLLSACSGGAKPAAQATSPAPTATRAPIVVKPAAVEHDLISGTTRISHASLVAIKVDNAPLARPYQSGLGKAAVVYQEIVEGGLTRFLAVFESDVAGSTEVGPIRSGRESDVDILRTFGKIPIGFSGAQPGVKAIFHAAQSHGWLRDASYDVVPAAYRLGAQRKDARNFFTTPAKLAAAKPGSLPRDIGFRFGTPTGGLPTPTAVAHFSPDSRVGLTWNPATSSYSVSQNGSRTNGAAPTTVIIQMVNVHSSGFVDVHKQPTPRTISTGAGKAVVLRAGARVEGTWKRNGLGATHFLDATGKDITLAAGPVWVLLLPTTGSVAYP